MTFRFVYSKYLYSCTRCEKMLILMVLFDEVSIEKPLILQGKTLDIIGRSRDRRARLVSRRDKSKPVREGEILSVPALF